MKRAPGIVAAALVVLLAAGAAAEQRSLRWERIQVEMELTPAGDLVVAERLGYVVDGAWNGGERRLPLDVVRAYDDISLQEEGRGAYHECKDLSEVGCFTVTRKPGQVLVRSGSRVVMRKPGQVVVRWRSRAPGDPPYRDAHVTFVLRYTARGVVRRRSVRLAELSWNCLFRERPAAVERAAAALVLPDTIDPSTVRVRLFTTGDDVSATAGPDGIVRASARDVPPGDAMRLLVVFPAEGSGVAVPEPEPVPEEPQRPIAGPLVLVLLLGAFAYPVVRRLWRPRSPVEPETLEPPEDLPPALAGALAGASLRRQLTAALLELARRGVVRIERRPRRRPLPFGRRTETVLVRTGRRAKLEPWHRTLLDALDPEHGEPVNPRSRRVRRRLRRAVPQFRFLLVDAMQKRGLLRFDPDDGVWWSIWLGVQLAIALAALSVPSPPWPWGLLFTAPALAALIAAARRWARERRWPAPIARAPHLGLFVLAVVALWGVGLGPGRLLTVWWMVLVLSGAYFLLLLVFPHLALVEWRSRRGLEVLGRLRALRRGLRHLQDLGPLETARKRLEALLPYAVALGLERALLKVAPDSVEAMPSWYHAHDLHAMGVGAGGGSATPAAIAGPAGVRRRSYGLASALSSLSSSLAGPVARAFSGSGGDGGGGSGGGR